MKKGVMIFLLLQNMRVFMQGAAIPTTWTELLPMRRGTIETYFRTTFREHSYGGFCGNHLLDFLAYGSKVRDPIAFVTKIVALFHSRMQEAQWMNPYMVESVLQGVKAYVQPTLEAAENARFGAVKQAIYDMLLTRFDELKENPDVVLTELTHDIMDVVDHSAAVRLRMSTVHLVENMLSRLIWLLSEQEDAWHITRKIAEELCQLHEIGLIPDAITLNQCLWMLTYRFSYCIESMGETLSLATYAVIKEDIIQQNSVLFSFQDMLQQQSGMKTRAEWLSDAIFAGEVRARQVQEGSWVAPLILDGLAC